MAKRKPRRRTTGRRRARRAPAVDYDGPWKEALDHYFDPCLAFYFSMAHADIDWGRGYEMLDKELQPIVRQAKHGRRYVDKLVKVWLKSGEEKWLLVHVEVQAWKEGDFTPADVRLQSPDLRPLRPGSDQSGHPDRRRPQLAAEPV